MPWKTSPQDREHCYCFSAQSFCFSFCILPGACSVPLRAKLGSLVCAGWCIGLPGLAPSLALTCPFLIGGHCISAKLSYVSVLLWGNSTHQLIGMALGVFPNGKCHQLACLAPVSDLFLYYCKQQNWHNFLVFLPSYIELIYVVENMFVDHPQNLEIENSIFCIVYSVRDLKHELSASSLRNLCVQSVIAKVVSQGSIAVERFLFCW